MECQFPYIHDITHATHSVSQSGAQKSVSQPFLTSIVHVQIAYKIFMQSILLYRITIWVLFSMAIMYVRARAITPGNMASGDDLYSSFLFGHLRYIHGDCSLVADLADH